MVHRLCKTRKGKETKMEETTKPLKNYTIEFTQDFGSVSYSVNVKASSFDEAVDLASEEENEPSWIKKLRQKAKDLGIDPDGSFCMSDAEDFDEDSD